MLPILTLVLLGLGVYVARGHRRALIGAGLGFAGPADRRVHGREVKLVTDV